MLLVLGVWQAQFDCQQEQERVYGEVSSSFIKSSKSELRKNRVEVDEACLTGVLFAQAREYEEEDVGLYCITGEVTEQCVGFDGFSIKVLWVETSRVDELMLGV
ncbi:hypothetical protein Droror1_Dr00000164 [Drosera rotundifolia]